MESRRLEIESKRQRLEELRKQREKRLGQIQSTTPSSHSVPTQVTISDTPNATENLTDQNELVKALETLSTRRIKSISTQTDSTIVAPLALTLNKGIQTDASYLEQHKELFIDQLKIIESEIDSHNKLSFEPINEKSTQLYPTIDETKLSSFLANSFKIINRAIQEDKDILRNYSQNGKARTFEESKNNEYQLKYQKLDVIDPTSNLGVFSIAFSPFNKDIMAFSTGNIIHIYNLHFQKMESQLKSTSNVISVKFSIKDPDLVIGACFNGKIKIWNLTENRETAQIESTISKQSHSYPVLDLVQFIENNRELLISSSSDGKVCFWDSTILGSKTLSESFTLKSFKENIQLSFYDEISPSALVRLGKPHMNDILVGTEDGNLYQFPSHRSMIKTIENTLSIGTIWKCHEASITALCTPLCLELSNIVATASLDWKCICWNITTREKILEIYRDFPIMDIAFRPKNPIHLALIYHDVLEIVDLSNNLTVLLISGKGPMLNRLSWFDDSTVALGDVKGKITLWDLSFLDKSEDHDMANFKRKHNL